MSSALTPSPVNLLQALAMCFEKDELLDGWVYRYCPLPSEDVASRTFEEWLAQLALLKGAPERSQVGKGKRAEWRDLRVKQEGRGIVFWMAGVEVWRWWQDPATWEGERLDAVFDWGPGDRGYRPAGWQEGSG